MTRKGTNHMEIKQLQFVTFDADTATEKDFSDAIFIQLANFKENNPNDPPPPTEMIHKQLSIMNQNPIFKPHVFLVYGAQGALVGGLMMGYPRTDSPDYEQQKHMGFISPIVLSEYRRQGIGTEMLRYAVRHLQENGKTLLQGETNSDIGRAFAQSFGAQVGIEGRENRLYVKDIDWVMIEAWANTGAQANPDVSVAMFEGLPEDADIEAYSALYTEVFNQQPLDDTEGLEITWTPERMRQVHQQMSEIGKTDYVMFSREADGTLSGLTEMAHNPKRGHRIGQGLTGVQAQYRGRGIGKWLKAKMLLYMRDTFPDVEFIATQNAMSNAAMNSINERLGFKQYKHSTLFKINVADIAQKLES